MRYIQFLEVHLLSCVFRSRKGELKSFLRVKKESSRLLLSHSPFGASNEFRES